MGADAAVEEQFGPYVVYERLGVGGMATVHRALERGIEGFERIVALKRLLPHLAADASFIKSFVREAKLASLLNHVNIVQIFELGRVGTQYFISMEYIDGRDIRRILRHARKASGPPPIHVTVGLLLQLCDALDYAHHKPDDTGNPLGLVHRDVSPSNVIVTSAGQVKVIDFGIAKAQSSQLRTQTNRVKGKLAYMAPEALAGKDLDARSDLFAVGVIGHELLTARPLFATKNEYQTLMKVQRGDIAPPSTFNPGCPPELDAIVFRALARDPDERFHHASDLRDALHAMRKQHNLQTSHRDIATWLEWAFSLEVPSGGFQGSHTLDLPHGALELRPGPRHGPSSRPRRTEDDEAIDLAWGGGDEHNSGDPIVLDDVPDVTDKHRANASLLGADVRLDLDDLADDVPTPVPSHGGKPPAANASRTATAPARPPRPKQPMALPAHGSQVVPTQVPRDRRSPIVGGGDPDGFAGGAGVLPRGIDRSGPVRTAPRSVQEEIATPNHGVGVGASAGVRRATIPPRMRTITIPPPGSPSSAQRTVPSLSPPPPTSPPSATPSAIDANEAPTPPLGVPTTPPPPRSTSSTTPPPRGSRATSSGGHATTARRDISTTERTPILTIPEATPQHDASATDLTPLGPLGPALLLDDFGLPSDTMPSVPTVRDAESIVRFRAPTNPSPAATPAPASRPGSSPPRQITPEAALFADPDTEGEGEPAARARAPSQRHVQRDVQRPSDTAVPQTKAAPPRRTARRVVMLLVVPVLVGALATAAALYLLQLRDTTAEVPRPPAPPSNKTAGIVKLVIVPADSEVAIEGKPTHTGSPWDVDLAPGVHQIAIHHDGYKGWLTSVDVAAGETQVLRVVLEPLGSSVITDATLIVNSTPSGLEAVLDGAPVATRTPIKLPIKAGPHTLVLRMSGVDVWKQPLDAQARAVYEFNPTITDLADRTPREVSPRPTHKPVTADPSSSAAPVAPDSAPVIPTVIPPGIPDDAPDGQASPDDSPAPSPPQ